MRTLVSKYEVAIATMGNMVGLGVGVLAYLTGVWWILAAVAFLDVIRLTRITLTSDLAQYRCSYGDFWAMSPNASEIAAIRVEHERYHGRVA